MSNADTETYLLLLLADGNLPTGSFVASSGLESYVTHGFCKDAQSFNKTIDFVRDSVGTYAKSALPFVSDTYRIVEAYAVNSDAYIEGDALDRSVADLRALDDLYEVMTLNHVAKRASKSQGVALLTLYSRGFSLPPSFHSQQLNPREAALSKLVDRYKLIIRKEETSGHLAICWGLLTAALGLSLERCQYLHLFLHARSLLSAAVRLNTIGPYASQQALLHAVRPIVDAELSKSRYLRTGLTRSDFNETSDGPATTWPLGEILASRHDLQHSRIFNS